jgi:hypothetical protein
MKSLWPAPFSHPKSSDARRLGRRQKSSKCPGLAIVTVPEVGAPSQRDLGTLPGAPVN